MFTAKLIEDQSYYGYRHVHFLFMFIPILPVAIVSNFFQVPIWLAIVGAILYFVTFVYMFKNQKKMLGLIKDRALEIDEQEIRIKTKSDSLFEIFPIKSVDNIIVKEMYAIPGDTFDELKKEIKGESRKNYITIESDNKKTRFDFEVDSYYMLKQLSKIIENWETQGYPISKAA